MAPKKLTSRQVDSRGIWPWTLQKFLNSLHVPSGVALLPADLMWLSPGSRKTYRESIIRLHGRKDYEGKTEHKKFIRELKEKLARNEIRTVVMPIFFIYNRDFPNYQGKNHASLLLLNLNGTNDRLVANYFDSVTNGASYIKIIQSSSVRKCLNNIFSRPVKICIEPIYRNIVHNGCVAVVAYFILLILRGQPIAQPGSPAEIRAIKRFILENYS